MSKSATPKRFDQWASSYDDSALQPLYHAALTEAARLPHAPGRILDIGCGTSAMP